MIKRFTDFTCSILGLVLFSPLLAILGVIVRFKLGSPIVFKQIRPGLFGKPFTFYKFRTMTNETDENENLVSDEDRLTSIGNLLRKTSLDELPSLLNVLRGEMSLVGPRPLLMEYLPLYSDFDNRRHEVLPGITGWAQINGRNAISWEEKFKLDVWYVDHQSFLLDVGILFLTLLKVLKRSDISSSTSVTMEKFEGSN
jgi:sugar transferase EpsL